MTERKIYIEIYWNDHDFHISESLKKTAIFISSLFRYYLPKIKTKNTKKINIELLRYQIPYENIYPVDVTNADIIHVSTLFDFEKFDALSLQEKKELLLQTVYEQLVLVFERLQVDTTVLKETYNHVIRSGFTVYIKLCGPEKLNSSRTIKAVTILEYFIGYDLLSVVFSDKNDQVIKKIELFKIIPNCFMYIVKFDKWLDSEVFQISDPSKRIKFYVNLNGTITSDYNATDKEDENRLKELVKMCTIE